MKPIAGMSFLSAVVLDEVHGTILVGYSTIQANGSVAFVKIRTELGGHEKFVDCETISTITGTIIYKLEDSHIYSEVYRLKMEEESKKRAEEESSRIDNAVKNGYCFKCGTYCYGDCK